MRALHVVVSSLLLFAIVVSLAIAAYLWGIPQVEKSKDIATIESMKTNMELIDSAVRSVAREGEDSYRKVELHIARGRLDINGSYELIEYKLESQARVVEPDTTVREGRLYVQGKSSPRGEYITRVYLNYSRLAIDLTGEHSLPKGYYTLSFKNLGYNESAGKTQVEGEVL